MNMTIDNIELPSELSLEDKWILSKLNTVINDITYNLENFDMGVAAQKVYDFIWNTFCDWYIELSKNRLSGTDEAKKKNVENVLAYVLINILKLLHPFMPYITEEIYQALPHEEGFLMMQSWPVYDENMNYPADEMRMEKIMEAVRAVRECRSEHKVPNSRKTQITILTDNPNQYAEAEEFLTRLAGASQVVVTDSEADISSGMITVATSDAKLYMPLRELIDIEAERLRIQKELVKAHKELEFASSKLENQGFIDKAPEKVVSDIKEKAAKANALIQNLQDMLTALSD